MGVPCATFDVVRVRYCASEGYNLAVCWAHIRCIYHVYTKYAYIHRM